MTSGPSASASAPGLVVRIGSRVAHAGARDGVAVIGRDPSATVRVNDGRISRSHVRLEPRRDGWQVIDTSTNGMFVDGVRRNSALITGPTTIHLGDADGIPVTLVPGGPRDETVRDRRSNPMLTTRTTGTSWPRPIPMWPGPVARSPLVAANSTSPSAAWPETKSSTPAP